MDKIVDTLAKTPLPTILVVAGIVFLFLAIGGQLGARFSTERLKPIYALVVGLILLGIGIWLQISSWGPSQPKTKNATVSSTGETYLLRKPAIKGSVTRTISRMEWPESACSLEEGGKYSQGSFSYLGESNSLTETLAVENDHPTVMREKIISDTRTSNLSLGGAEPHNDTKKGPLEGVIILVELKNGRWVKTLLNGAPTKEQKDELQRQWVDPDEIYPIEKVAPGYSWQLKDNQMFHFFPDALSVSGNAWCKFSEVVMRQNQQCAVISSRVELVSQTLVDNQPTEVHVGATVNTYRALDKLVDIESSMDGQMTMKSSWIAGGSKTTMELSGPFHWTTYNSDVTNMPGIGRRELRNVPVAMLARFGGTSLNISAGDVWARSW